MDTTTINTTTMSDSDSIFNSPTIMNLPTTQLIGGSGVNKTPLDPSNELPSLVNNLNTPEPHQILAETVPVEPIGIPVYLSGIIQLLAVVILLSKNKTRQASILFFTIGIYMLTVHCTYSGKSNTLSKGQFNALCRNFSYLLVLLPLLSVIMVLVDDFENAWKNIKYNSGKIQLQLPTFTIKKNKKEEEEEVLS